MWYQYGDYLPTSNTCNFDGSKIKNRSRLFYLTANIEASQFAGDNNWALLLGTDGFITEGTGDNFFIIKDGVVISPEGRDILRGISRDYVMKELCPSLGIEAIEKNIDLMMSTLPMRHLLQEHHFACFQ